MTLLNVYHLRITILFQDKYFYEYVSCRIRNCWVCYASDDEDLAASWVKPCKCRGTTKWVHQMCIQRWIDEKQKGDCFSKVPCPQCGTIYHIVFPEPGKTRKILKAMISDLKIAINTG